MTVGPVPGTPMPLPEGFEVTWDPPEQEQLIWFWDDIHSPTPATPAQESLRGVTMRGAGRAGVEMGDPRRGQRKQVQGYSYSAAPVEPPAPEVMEEYRRRMESIVAGTRARWDTEFLPRLERDLATMSAADLSADADARFVERMDEFLEMAQHHWYIHMMTVGPLMYATGRLAALYAEITGSDDEGEPYALLLGFPNKSLEADLTIRGLAAEARGAESVRELFQRPPGEVMAALERTDAGRRFRASLDRYLETYGYRSLGTDVADPTWRDDPTFVLLMLKEHIHGNPRDLEAEAATLVVEREERTRALFDRIGADEERRERFRTLLEQCQALWPLREDHSFYIDQRSTVMLRYLLLAAGWRLASSGRIAATEDVFFLTVDEIKAALGGDTADLGTLVAERRARWERNRAITPPPFIGTAPEGEGPQFDSEMRKFTNPVLIAPAGDNPTTLRGIVGSSGVASGVARVVRSPDEFARVNPGDILVTRSTTPAWTPIFASVGGLVTDSGGVLSHTAIVAREYGLPAVVGTRYATRFIKDGQAVTVDAVRGLVHLQ